MLTIHDHLVIPERELDYRRSRSSGPGGQNVNKVETRITLLFDIGASAELDDAQKELIRTKLATRISKDDVLRVISQKHRTQKANREAAREKFVQLLADALHIQRPRRPTRTPRRVERRRLEEKKRRGELKRRRGPVRDS